MRRTAEDDLDRLLAEATPIQVGSPLPTNLGEIASGYVFARSLTQEERALIYDQYPAHYLKIREGKVEVER